jgi:hypothetical protein
MTTDYKEIESSALNLTRKNKARLAETLLLSIHGNIDHEIEQAWIEEVQRREASLKSGETTLYSASDVMKEARNRIQK